MNKELDYKLGFFLSSIILEMKFEMLHSRITLFVKTVNNGYTYSEIIINKVSAYLFMNDFEKNRKKFIDYEIDNILELSEIGLIDSEVVIAPESDAEWLRQFKSGANIYIEMGTRFLFIEAGEIIINGESYILNY